MAQPSKEESFSDVWRLVAQHVPALPIQYVRLAPVNQLFYRVFMSDALWSKVDVCGVKQNIAEHYIALNYMRSKETLRLSKILYYYHVAVSDKQYVALFSALFNSPPDMDFDTNPYDHFMIYCTPQLWQDYSRGRYENGLKGRVPCTGLLLDKAMASTGQYSLIGGLFSKLEHLRAVVLRNAKCIVMFRETDIDRDTWLLAVHCDSRVYRSIPQSLRLDREFALEVVKGTPLALEYAPAWVKEDKELVLTSISLDEMSVQHASSALKSNPEIMLSAITTNSRAFELRDDALRANTQIAKAAVSQNGMLLKHCPKFHSFEHEGAEDIIMIALRQSRARAAKFLSPSSLVDTRVTNEVLRIVEEDGHQRVLRRNLFPGLF